ncbi:hypothetical protein P5V15_002626 [Pogonomyrmex californicus]
MNSHLQRLLCYASSNGLVINLKKTQAMWIGSRGFISRLNRLTMPPIILGNDIIDTCSSLKLLGFTIDSTLKERTATIDSRSRNSVLLLFIGASRLTIVLKDVVTLSSDVKVLLTKALVLPYFDYCAVLYSRLTNELTIKM